MNDTIKKYWFVGLVALVLFIGIGYFAVEQSRSTFKGKKVGSKYVVSQIDGESYFADDYYTTLLGGKSADQELYTLFERGVLSNLKLTDEATKKADEDAKALKQNYAANQGQQGLDYLDQQLRQMGYSGIDELPTYFKDIEKRINLARDYAKAHKDEVVTPYITKNQPRLASHILVKMKDSSKPTEDELKRVAAVDEALKTKAFDEVALEFSEDEGSATKRGSLGLVTKDTQFVEPFLKEVLKQNTGDVSEWVVTEHGYHRIKTDAADYETLIENDDFVREIISSNESILVKSIWEASQDMKVTFDNKDIEVRIKKYVGQ